MLTIGTARAIEWATSLGIHYGDHVIAESKGDGVLIYGRAMGWTATHTRIDVIEDSEELWSKGASILLDKQWRFEAVD